MIKSIKKYWDITQSIGETIDRHKALSVVSAYFDRSYSFDMYETSKDEVLQIYNHEECYTIIGGSSGDKFEWKSNFNALPLVDGIIHNGFYHGAIEVIKHKRFKKRDKMYYIGHSRGGAISSVLCYITGSKGVGFGVPKAFRNKVDLVGFYNVINNFDPVCHVVPTFRAVGVKIKKNFIRNPHTGYGRNIKDSEIIC